MGHCQLFLKYLLNLEMIVCFKLRAFSSMCSRDYTAGQSEVFLQLQILGWCIDFGPLAPLPNTFMLSSVTQLILTWIQVTHLKLALGSECITAHIQRLSDSLRHCELSPRRHAPLEPSAEISPANPDCCCSPSQYLQKKRVHRNAVQKNTIKPGTTQKKETCKLIH